MTSTPESDKTGLRSLINRMRGEKGKGLAKTMMIFAGGNIGSLFLSSLGGLIVARLVEPATLGLFNSLSLAVGYARSAQLGVITGLRRELPLNMGRGNPERARELCATTQVWSLFMGGVLFTALTAVAAWQGVRGRWDLTAGWMTYAAQGFVFFFARGYLESTYRTLGEFSQLAVIKVADSVVSLFAAAFVWFFGFYGLCLRLLSIEGTNLFLLWRSRPMHVRPKWNKADFIHLLKIGLPIYVTGQSYALWAVANSNLVLLLMGKRALGLYALASMVVNTLIVIPMSLTQVLFPMMTHRYGSSGKINDLRKMAGGPALLVFLAMIPIVAGVWVIMPPVIRWMLPKYTDGIDAARWSAVTALVMSFSPVYNIFNIVRRNDLYIIAICLGLVVYGAALFLLTRNGAYLAAFPQSMVIGRIAFIAAGYIILGRIKLDGPLPETPVLEPDDE